MFLPNDVLQYVMPARAVRVLWIDRQRALACTFELGLGHGQPRLVSLPALAEDVLSLRARLLLQDPYAAAPPPPRLPSRHRELQQKAWAIVAGLQACAPALYAPRERAAMVAEAAARHGVSRATVLRYLRRFWERGQTPDALLPDYGNSGARGKTRGASEGIKRGRPRKAGQPPGLNVDDATRAIFRAAVARHGVTHAVFSRRGAYRQMLQDFYSGAETGAVPSFGQFNYWLDKDSAPDTLPRPAAVAVQHAMFS